MRALGGTLQVIRLRLATDRRGSANLIQFVVVLPIFVLLIYGSFEIWKIVSVKQSLGAATYQAARCRSVYNQEYPGMGVSSIDDEDYPYGCEVILLNELLDNSFVDREDLIGVEITYRDESGDVICVLTVNREVALQREFCDPDPTRLGRRAKFDVQAKLPLPWPVFIPGVSANSPTLGAQHRGYIEGGPRWRPIPTPTPTPEP